MPSSKKQPGSPPSDSSHSISDDITVTQESSVNSQGLALNSVSDLNLVEMTEVEYTHLQQILYSQMEAQAAEQDGSVDTRLDSVQAVFQSVPPQDFAEYEARTPSIPVNQTENSPSSDLQFVTTNLNHQGQVDYQEFKMILMSDPVGNTQVIEKTPTSCGEVPGPVLSKIRNAIGAVGDRRVDPGELRPSPAARVRLEKRFSCSPCDVSRLQYTHEQSATLNNFLSMLHHPTDLFGLSMQSEPSKYIKVGHSKLASSGPSVNGGNSLSSISQAQNLGTISHILESGKHQDLIIPKNFSFSYQQDTEPIKAAFCTQTKPVMEPEVWIKLDEETLRKPVPPSKRVRGRQMCPERHALNDIQNSVAGQGVPNTRRSTLKAGVVGESLQRRERHNSMERDRRRRIRICCDELNMLVPFCNPETDKATTLQWTTAFLKYIKEVHGDSLRKEFQNAFCGKTGKRIKLVHSSSDQTTTYGEPPSLPATQSAEFKGS